MDEKERTAPDAPPPPAVDAAVRAVIAAWTDPGPEPLYHAQAQRQLTRGWPSLANALIDLSHAAGAPNTPAEARTGISDRTAAALTDVATLRYRLRADRWVGVDWAPELDRIEAALRGES